MLGFGLSVLLPRDATFAERKLRTGARFGHASCTEYTRMQNRCLFLECPDNFSGPESYFMSVKFTFKIENSKLTKQVELVCGLKVTPPFY